MASGARSRLGAAAMAVVLLVGCGSDPGVDDVVPNSVVTNDGGANVLTDTTESPPAGATRVTDDTQP